MTAPTYSIVRHPDFQLYDEVRIRLVERWKDGELSGSEWRFSTRIEFLYKGLVIHETGYGGDMHWAIMGMGHQALLVSDSGVPDKVFKLERELCAQPGCQEKIAKWYRVKALYDNAGHREELPRSYHKPNTVCAIGFCDKHTHRGDCGLQDSDLNYELIEDPK
jgi:hypothetical protein